MFACGYLRITAGGFPHSDICGSSDICSSPQLFAACHVLHRLPVPRHPPYALSNLTIKYLPVASGRIAFTIVIQVKCLVFSVQNHSIFTLAISCLVSFILLPFHKLILDFASIFALLSFIQFSMCTLRVMDRFRIPRCDGGPGWTRTTDITLIRRAI